MNTDDRIIDFVLLGLITVIVILKLTNVITVSWFILLIPIWLCLIVVIFCMVTWFIAIIVNLIRK